MRLFKKKIKIKEINDGRFQSPSDKKTIIVHHYCPHTFNIGDHFVIRSIRKYLNTYLPEAVFIPKACAKNRGWGQPVRLQGENINLSNKYADAVIIGGSDQYNNWALRIKQNEVRKLIPALYLIGLGVSSKSLNTPPFIEKKEYYEDIRITNEKAILSSVRDNYTKEFLEQLGYNKAIVTGCPALHLFDEDFHLYEGGFVALTFPFPVIKSIKKILYQNLITRVKEMIGIVQKCGLQPIITCHDDRDVFVAQQLFPNEKIFYSNYVDDFIDFYRKSLLVVGSRLHASIFVAGIGKPFVNINIDRRGQGFTDTFKLGEWNLNIDDPELNKKLEMRVKTIISGDLSVFNSFSKIKSKYRGQYLKFMKDVAVDIKERVAKEG
jgi:hypothetical protein